MIDRAMMTAGLVLWLAAAAPGQNDTSEATRLTVTREATYAPGDATGNADVKADDQPEPKLDDQDAEERSTPDEGDDAEADDGDEQPQRPVEEVIGLTAAEKRLGRDVPVGRGVIAGHVEGIDQRYVPNWRHQRFKGTLFVQRSGQGEVFQHASQTAALVYGRGGMAPGIRVAHCFSTRHWLTDGYLMADTDQPPTDDLPKLFNHSWIADPPRGAELVLRRVDYQIDRRNVIMCVGVNNGRGSRVPSMLASAYNVIAVGSATGGSSGGYTAIETSGRCKPDIVAPQKLTSLATPTVTAMVARLMEAAANLDEAHRKRAAEVELIKAVLLAGATKPKRWQPSEGKPLDEHLGAGMVNVDHSLQILQAGPSDPGQIRRRYGWDVRDAEPGAREAYEFETTQAMGEMSIVLAWNRRISGITIRHPQSGEARWVGAPRLADLDLRLLRLSGAEDEGATADATDGGDELADQRYESVETVAVSASSIDNVEHIYLPKLEPGRYRIEVSRQPTPPGEAWEYALAWRVELAPQH